MACKAEATSWVTFSSIAFVIMSTCTLLLIYHGMKQSAHLYYWFQVTTAFLDDFNSTFSACLCGFMSWKMSWNFTTFFQQCQSSEGIIRSSCWENSKWFYEVFFVQQLICVYVDAVDRNIVYWVTIYYLSFSVAQE